jgi:hypothetical protein
MSPEYFIIPIIMGQAANIIDSLNIRIILFDFTLLAFYIYIMEHNVNVDNVTAPAYNISSLSIEGSTEI